MLDGTRAWLEACELACEGNGPALALTRPAGHHASASVAMGFGLVNFAAASAAAQLEKMGPLSCISILDWDVSARSYLFRESISLFDVFRLGTGAPRQRSGLCLSAGGACAILLYSRGTSRLSNFTLSLQHRLRLCKRLTRFALKSNREHMSLPPLFEMPRMVPTRTIRFRPVGFRGLVRMRQIEGHC